MEADIGRFLHEGEIEGIGIEGKRFEAGLTQRGEQLSLQVRCTPNEEYRRG